MGLVALGLILLTGGPLRAASATLPASFYQPGRYVPLRVEAESAGVVRITGDGILPIEWQAAGRSAAVLPLWVVRPELPIAINGKPIELDLQPLAGNDDVPELTSFWREIDPSTGGLSIDPNAYALARLWKPGITDQQRRWMLGLVGISVLLLGVARHAWPKRATLLLAITAAGLAAAVWAFYPTGLTRRTLRAENQPGREWVWFAGGPGEASEPWAAGLKPVVERPDAMAGLSARLRCDAIGRPIDLSFELRRNERVVLLKLK